MKVTEGKTFMIYLNYHLLSTSESSITNASRDIAASHAQLHYEAARYQGRGVEDCLQEI